VVAFSDNILTARAFEARNAGGLNNNQELLAIGVANLAVGAAQGFPVSSSGSRTAIGDAMGSRSQLYSLVALGSVVLAVIFLGPVLAAFLSAALGAVVVYAAVRLVDVAEFRRIGGSAGLNSPWRSARQSQSLPSAHFKVFSSRSDFRSLISSTA
jgi:SulP family sulfate permease